ncbi:MAG TPA: hypothetical protein VN713_00650 [Sphingomicrobium sp.]|nr:hypothetical protein [Sphingomicrobium sp.]
MRLIVGALAAAGLFVAAPAVAQAQAGINVGMQVTDASGGPVGTVVGIQGANLLVKTDKHQVPIPRSSFTVADGKLLIGMTQAQLDSAIEQSLAAANAAIVAGASVKGLDGAAVGTVDSLADGNVVITLQDGKKIAVPQSGLRGNPDGTVTVGYSSAQLEAMVQGGDSSTSASSATTNTSGN